MSIKLKEAKSPAVRETVEPYVTRPQRQDESLFFHEELDVYQQGLALVIWLHRFLFDTQVAARYATPLDKTTTSLVLNIAEGNGRFSSAEHRRFLDIAHTSAMNTAAGLDLLVAKGCVEPTQIAEGKRILGELVPLLLGLRAYLEQAEQDG